MVAGKMDEGYEVRSDLSKLLLEAAQGGINMLHTVTDIACGGRWGHEHRERAGRDRD